MSLSFSAFADPRNAYSHSRSGNYNTWFCILLRPSHTPGMYITLIFMLCSDASFVGIASCVLSGFRVQDLMIIFSDLLRIGNVDGLAWIHWKLKEFWWWHWDDNNLQVVEHGLGHLPFTEKQVITPTGTVFTVGIVVMMSMAKNPSISLWSF